MASHKPQARVIGGGLAGCEAALTLADRGIHVDLYEMKPDKRTPAQISDKLPSSCVLIFFAQIKSVMRSGYQGGDASLRGIS